MEPANSHTSAAVDEATPLLLTSQSQEEEKPTPLLKFQIAVVIFLQIGEPLSSFSIYPYINQLISELDITGGDDKRVGYYAGLVESLFFATEALTVFHWSQLSDKIGRKPVLLLGLFGSMVSMLCFGLSKTFWGLIASRCLTGLLNGNIGVMKSVMGDLTDSTNRAEAFGLLSLVWTIGCTAGPFLGGFLSHPHERFPSLFGAPFWREYAYFLPCLAVSSYSCISFLVTIFFFKETVKARKKDSSALSEPSTSLFAVQSEGPIESDSVPFQDLMIYPVLLSVSNYTSLSFLHICLYALLPLFLAMPIEIGGLGLHPPTIGLILGAHGGLSGGTQSLVFARVVRYLGARKAFLCSMCAFVPAFLMFPVVSLMARVDGFHAPVWGLLITMLIFVAITDMGYGSIFMFVTASAPNKRSLGGTNGLSQMAVSIARAVGPALSTSLFSFAVQHNILGGYGLYPFLVILAILAILLAVRLPSNVWQDELQSK